MVELLRVLSIGTHSINISQRDSASPQNRGRNRHRKAFGCFGAEVLEATSHINRNMLLLTLLFIATGCPFSSSRPAAPPSPEMPSSFCRSSSSSSAIVFFFGFGSSAATDASFEAVASEAYIC